MPSDPPLIVDQTTFCMLTGVTPQATRDWYREGMPGVDKPHKKAMEINLNLAIPWVVQRYREGGATDKARLQRIAADRAELALLKEQGQLLIRDEVLAQRSTEVAVVRDRLLAAPQLIRAKLPVSPTPQQIEDAARSEIFNALATLGGEMPPPPPPKPKPGRAKKS